MVNALVGEYQARQELARDMARRLRGLLVNPSTDKMLDSLVRSIQEPEGAQYESDVANRLGFWLGADRSEEIRSHIVTCWLSTDGPVAKTPLKSAMQSLIERSICSSTEALFGHVTWGLNEGLSMLQPESFKNGEFWTTQTGSNGFGIFTSLNIAKVSLHDFWASLGVQYRRSMREKQALFKELCETGFWFWPGSRVCVCCERPAALKLDNEGRLHNENGASLAFRDGFEVFSFHDVVLPEYVVMRPHEITVEKIEAEQNAEVRRIMTERFGYGRYLSETGAKVLDMDVIAVNTLDEAFGSMPRALMEDKQGQRWLVGTDGSTKRVYYMRAPREANTCAEAHSALAGFDENQIIASS